MKRVAWIALVLFGVSFNTFADTHTDINGCEVPVDHIKELPSEISKSIPADDGVESFITLPLNGNPTALVFVTAPEWNFKCLTNNTNNSHETHDNRKLFFWAIKGNKWVVLDYIDNPEVIWEVPTYGNPVVHLIRDGDTTFLLEQYSDFQRTSFSDTLSFQYESNGKFRIVSWVSHSQDTGMYGGGPMDSEEGFEAKQKANPKISDFDGHDGEIDYGKKSGWITKYKFEEIPVTRKIINITEPASLENLRNLFFMPSFDCVKATMRVELAICNNQQLANEDSDLDGLFKQVKSSYDTENRTKLIEDQRVWLKQRKPDCIDKNKPGDETQFQSCLVKIYRNRFKELLSFLKVHKRRS